jgi:hypothetical protein
VRLNFLHNKGIFYGTVFILLLILIVLIKTAFFPIINLPIKNIVPTPTPKIVNLCTPFPTDQGEISCEEAKAIALKELPGSVLAIDRKSMNFVGPNGKSNTYKLWLVTIKSDKLIKNHNEFVLGIDVTDKKIKYSGLK